MRAKCESGIRLLVGLEIEMVLIDPHVDDSCPANNVAAWSSAVGLRNKYRPIVEEAVTKIQDSGTEVEQYHTEGAQGMFEIVLRRTTPMEAADALIRAQETIRAVCTRHGLTVTMFPKPTRQPNNVGQHIHMSICPTDAEEFFLAGVLDNLPAICAFTMPNYDSYTRVKDLGGTIGTWVAWGFQLRDVPVRKIGAGHWEFRNVDATSNIYVALASIIGSGLHGMMSGSILSVKDPRISPCRLNASDRRGFGIRALLPGSLKEALDELKKSPHMPEVVGTGLVTKYLEVKYEEEAVHRQQTEEARRSERIKFF